MRLLLSLIIFGLFYLKPAGGHPTTHPQGLPHVVQSSYMVAADAHSVIAAITVEDSLHGIERRAGKKGKDKGKGKATSPPQTPQKPPSKPPASNNPPKKPNGPATPPQTPAKPPQTPANPPPSSSKSKAFDLGECGSEGKGKQIKNAGQPGQTPAKPPNQIPKTPKTPRPKKEPSTADDPTDNGVEVAPANGEKKLFMCGRRVVLDFPRYPSSGDVVKISSWKSKIDAYNAVDVNPCNDNYNLGKVIFPKTTTDGIFPLKKVPTGIRPDPSKDIWDTEHVMDAQILKRFFTEMFAEGPVIKHNALPARWRSSEKVTRASKQTQCDYLHQFWIKRWEAPTNNGASNAMTNLLSVFPGDNEYAKELLLLPGRLNKKKSFLFSTKKKVGLNVIAVEKFGKMPFHQRINELREVVLLIDYLNEPKFQQGFKAVSERITDRLQLMERTGANEYMRQTDDYWYRWSVLHKKEDATLKDVATEKYKPVELVKKWVPWINNFIDMRIQKMEDLLRTLYVNLNDDWNEASMYTDLKKADKDELTKRMKALKTNINRKVQRQGLKIDAFGA